VALREYASRYALWLILAGVAGLSGMSRDPVVYIDALMDADLGLPAFEGQRGGIAHKLVRWAFERQGYYQPGGWPPQADVTQPGEPPPVDVYVDDGRRGGYEPWSPASPFGDPATVAKAVWNRHQADGQPSSQPLLPNVVNHLYATVRNRGRSPAKGVTLRAYRARDGQGRSWPGDWEALGASVPLAAPIPVGGSAPVSLKWKPTSADERVLVSVRADGDESNAERPAAQPVAPVATFRLVSADNNCIVRSFGSLAPIEA
jgi:hypothetical protein